MSEQWRVKSPDEMRVQLSCGSVYIDHEYSDRRTGLANLNLVGNEVTATLHGLTLLDVASLGEMLLDWMIAQAVPAAHAASDGPEPEPEDNDGRMVPDELSQLQQAGYAVRRLTPRTALPSEVASAMYGVGDATNSQIAASLMQRLALAGLKIVRVDSFNNKEVRDVGSFEAP